LYKLNLTAIQIAALEELKVQLHPTEEKSARKPAEKKTRGKGNRMHAAEDEKWEESLRQELEAKKMKVY
jgi:hypothetical protein